MTLARRVPQLETAGMVVSMSEKEFSRLSVLMDAQAGRLRSCIRRRGGQAKEIFEVG
jgi:hypothetical protein